MSRSTSRPGVKFKLKFLIFRRIRAWFVVMVGWRVGLGIRVGRRVGLGNEVGRRVNKCIRVGWRRLSIRICYRVWLSIRVGWREGLSIWVGWRVRVSIWWDLVWWIYSIGARPRMEEDWNLEFGSSFSGSMFSPGPGHVLVSVDVRRRSYRLRVPVSAGPCSSHGYRVGTRTIRFGGLNRFTRLK